MFDPMAPHTQQPACVSMAHAASWRPMARRTPSSAGTSPPRASHSDSNSAVGLAAHAKYARYLRRQ